MSFDPNTARPAPDPLLCEIADYVLAAPAFSDEAYDTARYCLADSLGCGMLALGYPACTKLLGPVVVRAPLLGTATHQAQPTPGHRAGRPDGCRTEPTADRIDRCGGIGPVRGGDRGGLVAGRSEQIVHL